MARKCGVSNGKMIIRGYPGHVLFVDMVSKALLLMSLSNEVLSS